MRSHTREATTHFDAHAQYREIPPDIFLSDVSISIDPSRGENRQSDGKSYAINTGRLSRNDNARSEIRQG